MSNHKQDGVELCSACRGDYEDPDVSAMTENWLEPDDGEQSDDDSDEEFPARRERR
jgi:hypothetical protein